MTFSEITTIIVGTIGLFFLIGLGVNELANKSCLSSYSNYQPQYSFFTDCRIMVNGVLTPVDIVRELK